MRRYDCKQCPLRGLEIFREFSEEELEFVSDFKSGEFVAEAGTSFLSQGANSAHVYTVLSGWGFRYKDLEDGRRQILNYAFPGELLGLQGAVLLEMEHSVQALTDMLLCVFERKQLWELFTKHPSLAYDLTWLAAREEQLLEDNLMTVGRRTAKERMAYFLIQIFERAKRVGMTQKNSFDLPLTQQHVADTLGLSLVHTNKTLRHLYQAKLISWKKRRLYILDMDGLAEVASWNGMTKQKRPFI